MFRIGPDCGLIESTANSRAGVAGCATAEQAAENSAQARVREESGALANFEEISVNPPDLPNPPVKGDWVTAWGAQYTVTTVRQPDAYGMIALALLQRAS